MGTTASWAKMRADIMHHQLLFRYCAAGVGATELSSTENLILNLLLATIEYTFKNCSNWPILILNDI